VTDISQTVAVAPHGRSAPAAPETATAEWLDRIIWCGIALVALFVVSVTLVSNFAIALSTLAVPGGACAALLAAAWFYRRRDEPRLASALSGTAQVAAFAAVGAPLSYIAASANLPLRDHLFDAADRALGFDWMALLYWMNANPTLHHVFNFAYLSFPIQATMTVLALALTARLVHLRVFVLAFMACAVVTIAISAALPAQGVWGHYGLNAADYPAIIPATREIHLPIFNGLRDGTFRSVMSTGSEGIITFPSLHAALGLIFIFALWPVPVLRRIGVALNMLMIASTPIDGGHYFTDVLAGLVIAFLCWLAARRIAGNAARI
jgi:membrane-associated phospholipid phosphatase